MTRALVCFRYSMTRTQPFRKLPYQIQRKSWVSSNVWKYADGDFCTCNTEWPLLFFKRLIKCILHSEIPFSFKVFNHYLELIKKLQASFGVKAIHLHSRTMALTGHYSWTKLTSYRSSMPSIRTVDQTNVRWLPFLLLTYQKALYNRNRLILNIPNWADKVSPAREWEHDDTSCSSNQS